MDEHHQLRILKEAEVEIATEYGWYADRAGKAVADRFRALVLAKIRRIAIKPELYPVFDDRLRRALVERHPYGILYALVKDEVVIVAVMHLKNLETTQIYTQVSVKKLQAIHAATHPASRDVTSDDGNNDELTEEPAKTDVA